MAEPTRSPEDDTARDTARTREPSVTHRRPRWVTVTFIVVGALVLAFVILKLTGVGPGGGGHGPGMHTSAGVTWVPGTPTLDPR